ncbi:MAG: signal peptidase I, partial [Lachnospiraceae bacterium]|nr:signal peptidase I [Lachnospiraceae bacterium]
SSVLPTLISFGVAFMVACVLALLIVKFVAIPSILSGDSMNNTIMNGDKILIEKVSYRFSKPKRYDIVVFTGPDGSDYVKRIIGLPGEVVTASEGYVYVNGQMLADDIYGKELMNTYNYGDLAGGIYLDDDEYCVLGDNRNDSLDSRNYVVGKLSSDDFKGRVCFKLWPLKAIK